MVDPSRYKQWLAFQVHTLVHFWRTTKTMHPDLSKKKILVVDDARENIDVLRAVLKDFVKMFALDGSQALKIATSNNPPDLVLLDIIMPDMDGYEVCRRMKANEKTLTS